MGVGWWWGGGRWGGGSVGGVGWRGGWCPGSVVGGGGRCTRLAGVYGSFRAPSAIRYLAGSMTKGLVMSPEIEAFVERVVDKVVEMSLDVGQCPADWVASIDGIRSALADHAAAVRT